MNLVPLRKRDMWLDTFSSFEDLHSAINDFFTPMTSLTHRNGGSSDGQWNPSVDLSDSDNELLVRADIPGMKKDAIKVSIQGDLLSIKGEKEIENEAGKESRFISERLYGTFNRTIQLPSEVDQDNVCATYKDGVLELRLSKREEARTKHIDIDVK